MCLCAMQETGLGWGSGLLGLVVDWAFHRWAQHENGNLGWQLQKDWKWALFEPKVLGLGPNKMTEYKRQHMI